LSTRTETEREAEEALKNLFGGLAGASSATNNLDLASSTQINDLSNLIKRKAKEVVDSKTSDDSSDPKKPRN
jgi:hypothetical protein